MILRDGVLDGVELAVAGPGDAIAARAAALGAAVVPAPGHVQVVVVADEAPQAALDAAWPPVRAAFAPLRDRGGGLVALVAPPAGEAARAGIENLARTLSIEWARFGIRPVAFLPGDPADVAELVCFLASPAGAYYSGCAFTLRAPPPTAPRPSPR